MQKKSFLYLFLTLLLSQIFFSATVSAGQWSRQKLSTDHGSRDFLFYVPDSIQMFSKVVSEKRPLLVGLHGCLQTPEELAGLAGLEKLAEKNAIYLLLPEQRMFDNLTRCWNWHKKTNQVRGSGEPDIITQMIFWAQKNHAVDSQKIYAAGPSAGGSMTAILLMTYPDVFAAGFIGSGVMYKAGTGLISGFEAAKSGSGNNPKKMAELAWSANKESVSLPGSVPVMIFNGDADEDCNPKNSLQLVEQFVSFNDLLDDGIANESVNLNPLSQEKFQVDKGYAYTHTKYGSNQSLVESLVVHGMGHGWSGGDDQYDYNFPLGPSETDIMWDFFSKHHKQ